MTIAGTAYTMSGSYDANGRLSSVTYPSGFTATYTHTSLGDVSGLSGGAGGAAARPPVSAAYIEKLACCVRLMWLLS
jgi:hypothetical protein